jgi:hypothetical protein
MGIGREVLSDVDLVDRDARSPGLLPRGMQPSEATRDKNNGPRPDGLEHERDSRGTPVNTDTLKRRILMVGKHGSRQGPTSVVAPART